MRGVTGDGGTEGLDGTGRSDLGKIGRGAGEDGEGGVTSINGLELTARGRSRPTVFLESHDGDGTKSGVS